MPCFIVNKINGMVKTTFLQYQYSVMDKQGIKMT